MKNNNKIRTDPEALKARLNQPKLSRAGVLRQVQATVRLLPNALRDLQQSDNGSPNGRIKTGK